jgi:hypothetical protein
MNITSSAFNPGEEIPIKPKLSDILFKHTDQL